MLLPTTEMLPDTTAFDLLTPSEAASVFVDAQKAAIVALNGTATDISKGAVAMADAVRSGHSLIYAAAGSSGLMALADASELPGTFGIPVSQIQIHMAGGVPVDGRMPGDTEDDAESAARVARAINPQDVAIVLSASGTTPYALAAARAAKENRATVIAIANNPGATLFDLADVSICLKTPPEVIAGSTRLGAGTAQKAALNLMSSQMGVLLGHVYRGQMVNVIADNAKLVRRAQGIIATIAGVSEDNARKALTASDGDAKVAILVAKGATPTRARDLLDQHQGHLGPCFQSLTTQ